MSEKYFMMSGPDAVPEEDLDDGNPMPGPGLEDDLGIEAPDGNPMPGPGLEDDI